MSSLHFMAKNSVTWCTLRYLRSCTDPQKLLARHIYSKTGQWPKEFDANTRKEIEEYWKPKIQKQDEHHSSLSIQNDEDKYYVLSMFPYPSGQLHMGHVRVYTISDVMARYHRLHGKQVIHPMGWDAFGLPAENAAIERGERPEEWTKKNIENMRKQLKDLCCSFDWNREFSTCDPKYYKWTQFIFLKMYEAGLVYQKEGLVNWDPLDQTVLADEQIDEDGHSWRSGAKVEKKFLRQWFIRTTALSKQLYDGLDTVDPGFWTEVMKQQKHWIGVCTGCRYDFKVKNDGKLMDDLLFVYTDYPEAIYGISHITLSHQHWMNKPEFYQNSEDASNGDILLRLKAVHPLTGSDIPVVVSSSLVTDALHKNDSVIGIPCTSELDKILADKFGFLYSDVFTSDGEDKKLVNSGEFSGLSPEVAKESIINYARENKFGGYKCSTHHQDWLISRQRYWGTPIPMIHCHKCKAVPVPYDELPVILPKVESLRGKGESPLKENKDWLNVSCPKCGSPAVREVDTMDTFVDSSWYFLRYLDPHNDKEAFSKELVDKHMPVDLYIGGLEHAIMHLYFARFFNHFLSDSGFIKHREPFNKLLTQGLVMGQSFSLKETGKYIPREQVDFSGTEPVEKSSGSPILVQWEKMSKSKYNGVDPQDVLNEFGVDTTRLCILHNVPPRTNRNWSYSEFNGVINWQSRIWNLISDFIEQKSEAKTKEYDRMEAEKWDDHILEYHYFHTSEVMKQMDKSFLISVAIARLQAFCSELKKVPANVLPHCKNFEAALADFVIMLSPFAPCFAEELWSGLRSVATNTLSYKWEKSVLEQAWPKLTNENVKLPMLIKVNGKMKFKVSIPASEFENLTKDNSVNYIQGNEIYKNLIQPSEVESIKFDITPSKKAILNFVIPSLKKTKKKNKES